MLVSDRRSGSYRSDTRSSRSRDRGAWPSVLLPVQILLSDEVLRQERTRARVGGHLPVFVAELDADTIRGRKCDVDRRGVDHGHAVPARVADPVRILQAQLPRI